MSARPEPARITSLDRIPPPRRGHRTAWLALGVSLAPITFPYHYRAEAHQPQRAESQLTPTSTPREAA